MDKPVLVFGAQGMICGGFLGSESWFSSFIIPFFPAQRVSRRDKGVHWRQGITRSSWDDVQNQEPTNLIQLKLQ